MKVRFFDSVERFLDRVEASLLEDEAKNALILGVVFRLRDGHSYGDMPPLLGCVEDVRGIAAVIVRTPPYHLLLCECLEEPGVLEQIAHRLAERSADLPGVHARRSTALRFAELWSGGTACRYELVMEQRLYRLTEVSPPSGVSGRLRLAGRADRDRLIAWTKSFVDEADADQACADPAQLVERLTEMRALAVWDDGGPVSMAAWNRPTQNGVSINLVYTPPEKRRRGYAAACVAALSQQRLNAGKLFCTLFADVANQTSNALYRRIGFRSIAEFSDVRFSAE